MCRRWDSNPHEVALTGFFESDKDCAMRRDAALRGAFMSLFAFLCGMLRVRVRPDCHQNSHQNHGRRTGYCWTALRSAGTGVSALPSYSEICLRAVFQSYLANAYSSTGPLAIAGCIVGEVR